METTRPTAPSTNEQAALAFAAIDLRAALAVLQAVTNRTAARQARTSQKVGAR